MKRELPYSRSGPIQPPGASHEPKVSPVEIRETSGGPFPPGRFSENEALRERVEALERENRGLRNAECDGIPEDRPVLVGFNTMKYRARIVDGVLDVPPRKKNGTIVRRRFPRKEVYQR